MKKKTVYAALAVVIAMGISVPCFAANSNADNTKDLSFLKSRGTLKYQSADGAVEFYGEDIMLLADKISTIPNKTFDPGIYASASYTEADINAETDMDAETDMNTETDMDAEVNVDTDMDIDTDTDADTDAELDTISENDSDTDETETASQNAITLTYVSNNNGTHQVIQGEDILETAEICNLIANPETYDDATGQAVYTCELCNYSIADTYNPDKKE